MKRWTFRILVCLILGAITTVAVAWGFAIGADFQSNDRSHISSKMEKSDELWRAPIDRRWRAHARPHWPHIQKNSVVRNGVGWQSSWGSNWARDSWLYFVELRELGWPIRALRAVVAEESQAFQLSSRQLVHGVALSSAGHADFLPFGPIWPGLVVDTLFYAAIWGGVFFGFTSAKRFIRAKRGRCPRCGYDLRGNLSAGCSECGWNRGEGKA